MIFAGQWRWPLVIGLTLLVGAALALSGFGRLHYDGRVVMTFFGDSQPMAAELKYLESEAIRQKLAVTLERVPSGPREIAVKGYGAWPKDLARELQSAGESLVNQSLSKRRNELETEMNGLRQEKSEADTRLNLNIEERKAFAPRSWRMPRKHPPERVASSRIVQLDHKLNEAKVRSDYYSRRLAETGRTERSLQPAWRILQPPQIARWPSRLDGWPMCSGILLGVFTLGMILFEGGKKNSASDVPNGLWRPEEEPGPVMSDAASAALPAEAAPETSVAPVELEVVLPEPSLPSDPLTEKAAELYGKWMEVAKALYQPAPEAPQGILEAVGALLEESNNFIIEGHDVLARYLARTVAPGDLPAHVARTVLMTLAGAQEAEVSPEHRLAMALAALFHDLAVVPRPAAVQEEAGSEVGRLSASVLRRIPGLEPALLAMVEEILVGMDEFKLATWQNAASGTNLEPLSKVLREIDRFEKVMQKQKARLDRQIAARKAV